MKAKKLFLIYQRAFFYITQARVELGKPMGLYTDAALAILLLKAFGFSMTLWQAILCYIAGLLAFMIVGKILVASGIVAYNAQLNNKQNPMFVEILSRIKRIERKITRKKHS